MLPMEKYVSPFVFLRGLVVDFLLEALSASINFMASKRAVF